MNRFLFGLAVLVLLIATTAWGAVGGGDITFSPPRANEVIYSHDFHVTKAGLKCTECHYKIFNTQSKKAATMADMEKGFSCGACHNGARAFSVKENCIKCHS